jgi:hypothetical protein
LFSKEVNWWFPTKEIVYVVKKPKECIVKDGNVKSLVCQDGFVIV